MCEGGEGPQELFFEIDAEYIKMPQECQKELAFIGATIA